MSSKSKLAITVAAVAAMSAGFWLSSMQQSNEEESFGSSAQQANDAALAEARKNYSPIQGTILSPARKIAVPALIKDDGEAFTIDDLTGQWHLLFFGYTHCPDVCPVTMGVAAQAKKIAEANGEEFPQVLFISVDPERDKVEMLGEYVRYFDKDFIGVTGDSGLIKALTLQLSVVYMKVPSAVDLSMASSAADYLVDHSSALLLLNPEAKLVAFMSPPHEAATILKDFQTVRKLKN